MLKMRKIAKKKQIFINLLKGSAPASVGKAEAPMKVYNPDARAKIPVGAPKVSLAKSPVKSSPAKGSSKGVNGVNVRTGQSGLVAVGIYKVNPKTGVVTYQKPQPQLKSAKSSSPSGDIKTGPQVFKFCSIMSFCSRCY